MVRRYGIAAILIFLVCFTPIAPVAWAALPTPSQPILIVHNNSSSDPYQNFVAEMLTTEGLNSYQTAELADLTAGFLTNYDVVVLPHLTLTTAQTTLFQNYVNAGGTLIGFRPDSRLASVFGVSTLGTTLSEGWLQIDTTTPYGSGLDASIMKYHGVADRYLVSGATPLAMLYSNSTTATTSPAATVYTYGLGKAVMFSFDLTQSIVLMRQGNPAWAGYPNNHDGFNTLRAGQMFMDKNSGQFWNDLGDDALNDVPQADIQMRLFSNAMVLTTSAKRPMPRLWYFPNQNRAMLLMTGDQHGDAASNSVNETNLIQSFGGKFTNFLWYPYGSISTSQVNTWVTAGNTMGIHFNDTAEVDSSGVGGSAASWNGMQSVLSSAIASFTTTYPSAPAPTTTRNHFLIWVSRNAAGTADQTAQAKLFQNNGIELDVSYTTFPNRWGYMTGSGLPMKFLDSTTGSVISVYEQASQYEDDVQLGSAAYSTKWNLATAQAHYQKSLSDSLTKYNTVVTMLFHPDTWGTYSSYGQIVLQYAKDNSIPIYAAGDWLSFWKARAATTVSKPTYSANTLTFTANAGAAGMTLLVPRLAGNSAIATLKVDNVSQALGIGTYQGVEYATAVLTAGTHTIVATYTASTAEYGISGNVSASGAGATVTLSGAASATATADASGNYTFPNLANGSYTITPTKAGYTFNPSNAAATINNANVTGINFAATALPPGQTLFTTQTPAVVNATDGTGINYELGMAFTSTTPGQITGIRFWKDSNESGAHTGRIWSSTGSLLASVAFTGETASGWQQQLLSVPIIISANTTYVVSVNTGNAYYVATNSGLATQIVNGSLKSVVGTNGLYGTPGAFPTTSWQGSNYFRDVVFVSGATYNISGSVSAAGSGATVTLSGPVGATTTADGSGNYTFTGLSNGSYTVVPSKGGATFAPASAPATINNADVTGLNFNLVTTYSISGNVSANGSGATVTLSGSGSATTTADGSGNYTFSGLASGGYTVTPTKSGYTFSPTSAPATISGANVTALNFTATLIPTYSISGNLSVNGSGATVALSGASSATATADGSGNYSFTGLANGSYTVTPTKGGYTFTPLNQAVTINSANVPNINFSAAAPVGGQTLFTTQTPAITSTSDGGGVNYELGTAFTSTASGQITAIRFWKSSDESGAHTGRIWSSTGSLLTSVTFTGETASGWQQQLLTTPLIIAANTTYVVTVNTGNSYYVATNNGLAAEIANGNLKTIVGNNGLYGATGTFPTNSFQASNYFRDIVFSPGTTYSIAGNVSANGSGATVTLSGASSATVTADVSGNYAFTGLSNGSYTVTPTKSGYIFSPTSAAATVNNGNVTGPNFTAAAITYSISGNVSANGSGATLTLTGAGSATTTADGSGNYTFTGLANGSYTVTPTKSGYTFSPTTATATISNASVTALNFAATANATYSISGSVSATGTGATVTLSGAASATTTADGSGNYTFTGLANGSYTVTPSKSGIVFTPLNQAATINNANVTALNFTAAASAGITIDATAFGDRTSSSTTVVTSAFSTTASNELLLAMVAADISTSSGTNNTVSSISGGGLTWTLVRRTNTQRGTAEIWRAFATTTLSNVTVTANLAISATSSITVMSFKGVNTTGTGGSGAIGASASGSGTTGTPTASLITTANNSLVVGVGEDWNAGTAATVGAGQTLIHQMAVSNVILLWTQRQTSTTPLAGTTVTINDTAPTNHMYNMTIAEVVAGN